VVSGNFANTGGMTTVVTGMSSYGKVSAAGTATIGGSLFVDAAGASGLSNGSLAGIVSGSSLTGTFSSVSTNSLLFSFVPVYQANQVDLSITALTPKVLDTTTALGNTPARGAAAALDTIFARDPGGAIAGKFLAFTSGQEQQLSGAVSQTLPVLVGGSILATRSAMVDINRIINDRFQVTKGLASGNDYSGGSNVWLKPFGSWADQSSRGAVAGYKSDTQGIGAGFDKAISPSLFLGAGFAYANSDVDGKSSVAPSRLDIDMYQLIGYGTYSIDHRTDLNFQLGAGKNRNESSRDIVFASTTASGRYDTKSAHIGFSLNRLYPLSARTSITPSLRADFTWIKDSSYTESGADALNLQVESRSAKALVLTLGGKVAHQVNEQLNFNLNLGAGYDTLHERASITTAFAGSPDLAFTTYGINPEPWIATAGVGAAYQLRNGPEISARYDAEQREGFFNQTASLKARWAF
jgi:outer membrane autotransporter protein